MRSKRWICLTKRVPTQARVFALEAGEDGIRGIAGLKAVK